MKPWLGGLFCTLVFLMSSAQLHAASPPDGLSRLSTSLRIGPAYEYADVYHYTQYRMDQVRLAVGMDFGVALDSERRATLLLQGLAQIDIKYPQNTNGLFAVGFQYDIPLGVKGLSLSPRLSVGYANALITASCGDCLYDERRDYAALVPELGITYVARSRLLLMLTPLNFPMFLRRHDRPGAYVYLDYHLFYSAFASVGFRWGAP